MTRWNYQLAHKAALQFSSKREFDRAYGGAYAWARRHGVLEEITDHMRKDTLWSKANAFAEASKHETRRAFQKSAPGCANWLRRNGFFDEACAHMKPKFVWTFDLVKAEVAKYAGRTQFHDANPSAAQWAVRNGFMDKLFPHRLTFWDFESVSKEALKFSYREEFRVGSAGAAHWAIRNGVWDTVCAHMDLASKSDYDCVYIWKPDGFDDLYKIGVTSKRLGVKRIEYVAGNNGMDVDLFYMRNTPDALRKEKEMLSLGRAATFSNDFNGFSEFRHLTDGEFLECLRIMGIERAEAAKT